MTHEEQMKKLKAETEYYRKQNDELVKKINTQLKDINNRIRGLENL